MLNSICLAAILERHISETKSRQSRSKSPEGDKVRVKYPDGMYEGVVKSSTAKRTIVFFAEDNTEDEFLPSEYDTIEIIKKA